MSYDILLLDPKTREVINLKERHYLQGGTYIVGGTTEAWLNVTYNYGKHFRAVLGTEGIRTIYGMTGRESIPILQAAANLLSGEPDEDYWAATKGNAKKALLDLIELAKAAPSGIWSGD